MTALDQLADWPVPTAAAAVIGRDGVLVSYGPQQHRFGLASVTKPLTALAALVAVEEEALTLEDDAAPDLLPGAGLRHLLAHASGMAPERPMRSFAPATRRVYSNVGIEYAAALVERATGIGFADYLTESVLAPMNMRATSLPGSPAHQGISTVADLCRLSRELLRPTGLLSEPMQQQLRTVQYPGLRGVLPGYGGQNPNDWGLGFEIRSDKSPHWTGTTNSPATYGHFGQSGTMWWVDPDASLALVALTDRDFGDWSRAAWPPLSDAVLAEFGPH